MRIGVTCSSVVERDGGILLVQEAKDPTKRFSLPGGSLENHESLFDCAQRETKEETGLQAKLDYLVGLYQSMRTERGNNITRFVFAATIIGGAIQLTEKHPIVEFFDYQEIERMGKEGLLRNSSVLPALRDYRAERKIGLAVITLLPIL